MVLDELQTIGTVVRGAWYMWWKAWKIHAITASPLFLLCWDRRVSPWWGIHTTLLPQQEDSHFS